MHPLLPFLQHHSKNCYMSLPFTFPDRLLQQRNIQPVNLQRSKTTARCGRTLFEHSRAKTVKQKRTRTWLASIPRLKVVFPLENFNPA